MRVSGAAWRQLYCDWRLNAGSVTAVMTMALKDFTTSRSLTFVPLKERHRDV